MNPIAVALVWAAVLIGLPAVAHLLGMGPARLAAITPALTAIAAFHVLRASQRAGRGRCGRGAASTGGQG